MYFYSRLVIHATVRGTHSTFLMCYVPDGNFNLKTYTVILGIFTQHSMRYHYCIGICTQRRYHLLIHYVFSTPNRWCVKITSVNYVTIDNIILVAFYLSEIC